MSMCPECFTTGSKANCRLSKCPYRRRALDNALDCFTAESQPDPLEEMAAGLCPECRNPLDGGDMSCTSSECRFYGRVGLDTVETAGKRMVAQAHLVDGQTIAAAVDLATYDESLYYFLQGTGRR